MRVLYVVTAAQYGGAPRHVGYLMRYFRNRGADVGLVSAPERKLLEEARTAGVRSYTNKHFVLQLKPWHDLLAITPVLTAIRDFRPDIVHAHSTKAGLVARFASALLGLQSVIFTAHGWAFSAGRPPLQRNAIAQSERLAAKATSKIICVSEYDRQLALKFAVARPDQLAVIHNGIDSRPFVGADGGLLRRRFAPNGEPVICMIGRLAPPKDPLALLRACLDLDRGVVLLVGDGPLRPAVEQYVAAHGLQNRVVLTGERHDIPQLLAASDLFVLVSRWEGLPLCIIEAMAAGLPVVASSVGGVPELVEEGITGYLVSQGNEQVLAAAIHQLISDEGLRDRLGRAGREKAIESFGIDEMLRKTAAVYQDVLSRHALAVPG